VMIECDGLSEKDLGFLGENTEDEKLNIINQLFSKADLAGTSVRKSISNMTEGYDYYDTEVMLNGIPTGGLSQYHYQGSAGFGLKLEDCYFKITDPASGERERNSYYAFHGRNYEIGGTICKRRKNWIFYGRGHDGKNRTNHDSSYENSSEILY